MTVRNKCDTKKFLKPKNPRSLRFYCVDLLSSIKEDVELLKIKKVLLEDSVNKLSTPIAIDVNTVSEEVIKCQQLVRSIIFFNIE